MSLPRRGLRVAYYYGGPRKPDADTNPYGGRLADALARADVDVRFETALDETFLGQHVGSMDIVHLNWPSHEYKRPGDDDRPATERRMHALLDALALARELGYKVVWTAHNLYPHDRRFADLDREFRLGLCRLTTGIIAHCELAAAAVRREFEPSCPVQVIPHGHFLDVLPPAISREDARAEVGIPPDAFVYGFVGNLLPYKGLEGLIEAFGAVASQGDRLYLVGGGPVAYRAELDERVRRDARIVLRSHDYAPGAEFVRVLQASDVIVLPFRGSTTSGSLELALSWPCPAIVPAMGCLPSQMDADAGILYPPDEHGALEAAMRSIRAVDLDAARAAARRSAERADWDAIARSTIEVYRA